MNYSGRGGNFLSGIPPVTRFMLVANVVIFIVDFLILKSQRVVPPNEPIEYIKLIFALYSFHFYSPTGEHLFSAYQLVTHMFVHGNFMHLFFNMFGLFVFGKVLETVLGSKKFFILYFLSGFGAAGLQLLVYYFQMEAGSMIGASGAILGITAAFAVLFPNVELMIIFIPIPIKAKYLIPFYMFYELTMGVANFRIDNIAHFAHIGGAIVGFILVMFWKKNRYTMY